MLDYAANAVIYWQNKELLDAFDKRPQSEAEPPDVEKFWLTVQTNLQAGRIRLLFVADKIPAELLADAESKASFHDAAVWLVDELKTG